MIATVRLVLAVLLLPAVASAQSVPTSTEERFAWNAPVFATGALVFAGSYAGSAIVAGGSDNPAAGRLYIPLAGPWLALSDWGECPIDEPRCDKTTTDKLLLVADGVFQAAGLITMVGGFVSPYPRPVPAPSADAKKLKLMPTRNGFAVRGHF